MQVIIHSNNLGGVSVTFPTGELPIEAVKTRDTPGGSIIVDDSTLPQGDDAKFFDAWELNGVNVTVNMDKAKAIHRRNFDTFAGIAHQKRVTNSGIGLPNTVSDADFLARLVSGRAAIQAATTTTQLLAVAFPE
jgi:hypothetical protein